MKILKFKVQHKYGDVIVEANRCIQEGNVVKFYRYIDEENSKVFLLFSLFNLISVEDISDGKS